MIIFISLTNKTQIKMKTQEQIISEYMAEKGSKGGRTTASRMTKEQRVERAKKAIKARYEKNKTI